MKLDRRKLAGRVAGLMVSCLPALAVLVLTGPLWASAQPESPQAPQAPAIAPNFSTSRKYADRSLVTLGEQMTYTILLTNTGDDKAASVIAVDALPDGVLADVQAISASNGSVTGTATTITWTGGLLTGTGAIITIPVTLQTCEPDLVNTVLISDPGLQTVAIVTASTVEGFERPSMLPPGWGQTDVAGTQAEWTQTPLGKHPVMSPHAGSGMVRFNSYDAAAGRAARLNTRPLTFLAGYEPRLSFWMYHDSGHPTQLDSLQLQVSVDGGGAFTDVGPLIQRYSPVEGWQNHIVSLAGVAGQTGVRLGLLGVSAFGNDLYLDDIALLHAPEAVTVTVQPSLVRVAGEPVTFTSQVNPQAAHWIRYWDFGDGTAIQVSPTVTHVYSTAGDFTATLRICGAQVYVQPLTVLPTHAVSLTSSGEHLLGSVAYLTATPLVGSLPVTYVWSLGDGLVTHTGHILSHTYPAAGVYTAVVTITNGLESMTATTQVRVLPIVDVSVTVALAGAASEVHVGRPFTAVARIMNAGPSAVVSATLRASIDPPGAVVAASPSSPGQCVPTTGQVTCSGIHIGVSDTVSVFVWVTPMARTTYTTTVEIQLDEDTVDADPAGYEAVLTTEVQSRQIFLAQALNRVPFVPEVPVLNPITNTDYDDYYVVSWGSVPGSVTYVLQEARDISFTFPVALYQGSATFHTITDRAAGAYYYRVKARSQLGDFGWSGVRSVEVRLPGVPDLRPIAQPPAGSRSYWVTWGLGARANSYLLQESTNDLFVGNVVYTTTVTSWQATDKLPGIYYYRVKASNTVGDSAWSPVRSVTVRSNPYNGLWSGTTSQGRQLQFEISNGLLVQIRLSYLVQSCSGEVVYTLVPPMAISGNAFSVSRIESAREYVVLGTFSTASQASGQAFVTLYDTTCNRQATMTWTASKISP